MTLLGVANLDERRGILLQVRRRGGKVRRVVAEQIWVDEPAGPNANVLDDHRSWVEQGGLDS